VVAGFAYAALSYPGVIPQQTDWVTPPQLTQPPSIATAQLTDAKWDPKAQLLTMTARVKNTSDSPVTLTAFRTAYLTFVNTNARLPDSGENQMTVEPSSTVGPGQTSTFTMKLPGPVLLTEELVPVGKPQMEVTGILELNNTSVRNMATVQSSLTPTST
jgi:hypothetical protein